MPCAATIDTPVGSDFGVDVVAIARMRTWLDEVGRRGVRRLLTDDELDWVAAWRDPAEAVAASLALKEATIKALGRRPRPFSWRRIATTMDAAADDADGFATLLRDVLGAGVVHRHRVVVNRDDTAAWLGRGRWLARDGRVTAIVDGTDRA